MRVWRKRLALLLALAGACGLVSGAAGALGPSGLAERTQQTASASLRPAAASKTEILYVDAAESLMVIGLDGSGRRQIAAKDEYSECSASPAGRWIACNDGDGMELALFGADGSGHGPRISSPNVGALRDRAWSPDGSQILFYDKEWDTERGDLYLWNLRTGAVKGLTNTSEPEAQWGWSRDGRTIGYSTQRGMWLRNLSTGSTRRLAAGWAPAWSPDGRSIAYTATTPKGAPEGIWVLNVASGRSRRLADGGGPEWSPDGRKIAYTRRDQSGKGVGLFVVDRAGGRPRRLVAGHLPAWPMPVWSPNGRKIAYYARQVGAAVGIVHVDGSGRTRIINSAATPLWSPDGAHVVYTSMKERERQIVVADAEGRRPRVLVRGCCFEWAPPTS